MKSSRVIATLAFFICLTVIAKDVLANSAPHEKVAEANNGRAVIIGHGPALPDEYVVRLLKFDDGVYNFVATDTIANRQFRFEIPVGEEVSIYTLMFDYHAFPTMVHKIYLTQGAKVNINAIDNYSYTWTVKSNIPEQAEYELFVNNNRDLYMERQKENIEYSKTRNVEALQAMDSLDRMIELRNLELLKTRPVGRIWLEKAKGLVVMSDRLKIDTEDLKLLYAALDDSLKNSSIGREIYGHLYPGSPIGIGDKFPETEFYDLDGNVHKFTEFQGKWCLVDIWNSGCAPCIRAIPELKVLKEKYPEKLELISLSIDSENIWRQASEQLQLTSNNWNEGKRDYGIFKRLGTNAYPTFFVVSPDGMIKDIWIGYATGELKQNVNFILRPKGETEYAQSNGRRTIRFPQYQANNTDRVLDIDGIEISDAGTKVFFAFVCSPDKWIAISPDAYLSDANGTKYKVLSTDGITLSEHLNPDKDGNGTFSITFEPIPETVNTIDFHESASNEGWTIEGIALKP